MNELSNFSKYNQLWMKLDSLYSNYAKQNGLTASSFWIFYTLYKSKEIYTQKDLSEKLFLSKQTINSSLKTLISDELIKLVSLLGQPKNKQVILTEKGDVFVQKQIIPILIAEKNALNKLNDKEQKALLELTQRHINFFQIEINKIWNISLED